MATKLSIATGNFTAAGTWAVCDATAENDSVAANTALTTSLVASTAFTPGVITINAIAVKIASVAASPTGTMDVDLAQAGVQVPGTGVTINVSDIDAGDTAINGGCGWYVFAFATPVVLLAATAYTVRAKTSSLSQVNLFSLATTNWSRELRTTTTQAPAVSDKLFIAGQFTAPATSSSYTVTMDNTATTAFGNMTCNNKSTFTWDTAAATAYYLKSQTMDIYGGATVNVGTTGTPIPATSSATIFMNSASSAQYGWECHGGSTVTAQGATKTVKTFMTVDKAAAATVITVVDTTGWKVSDVIGFPTTTTTATQCEQKIILTVDSATQITLTAGLTNAHSGTSPIAAEVANLTRNIVFTGATSVNTGYMQTYTSSSVDFDYVEFVNWGGTASSRLGNVVGNTTGTANFQFCSSHDNIATNVTAFSVTSTSGSTITISNNVAYGNYNGFGTSVSTTGVHTWNNNICIRSTTTNCYSWQDAGSTYTNNKAVGSNNIGFSLSEFGTPLLGTATGNIAHGNTADGFQLTNIGSGTWGSATSWRNANGFNIASTIGADSSFTLDSYTCFGNLTAGLRLNGAQNGTFSGRPLITGMISNGGTTTIQSYAVNITGAQACDMWRFENCSFGATSAHGVADIGVQPSGAIPSMQFYSCLFSSGTEISSQTQMPDCIVFRGIGSTNHDQVSGAFKCWLGAGTLTLDTTISRTASPSLRMAPNSSTRKLVAGQMIIPIVSGQTAKISGYVRESVAGDGQAYNGSRIRMILRRNYSLGITSDTVLATATAGSSGAFELLTATTSAASTTGAYEVYFDCNGTTGWVNIDDVTTDRNNDSSGVDYWIWGNPFISVYRNGGNATFT